MPTKAQLTQMLIKAEALIKTQKEKIQDLNKYCIAKKRELKSEIEELKEENGILKMGTLELVGDLKEIIEAQEREKEEMKKIINTKLPALDQELKVIELTN